MKVLVLTVVLSINALTGCRPMPTLIHGALLIFFTDFIIMPITTENKVTETVQFVTI